MRLMVVDGIKYHKYRGGEYYSINNFNDGELLGYLNDKIVESTKSPYNYAICDSDVELGYHICNTCKSKIPIEDEEIDNKNKNNKVPKVYYVYIQMSKLLKSSSRIKQVLEMAENHCELCNRQTEHLEIYVLDKDKPIEDIDSLLNIIALCPICKANVYKEKEKYIDDIKKKLYDRLDSII